MAKIKIVGDTLAIISAQSLEDIKQLAKYAPSELVITQVDDDGVKNEVFSVTTTNGKGVAGKYGVCFNSTTQDKKACVTMPIPAGTADIKAYAEDNFGVVVTHLNTIEARFAAALQDVANKRKAVQDCIEII